MAVADHGKHSRERDNFARRALRIAARHNDADVRIGALHAANVGTGIAIGFCGDGAGVDHNDIGSRGTIRRTGTEGFQSRGNCISVGLAGTAAEVFYVISCHPASVAIARPRTAMQLAEPVDLQIDNPI